MIRVEVKPALWQWTIERAGDRAGAPRQRFPHLRAWQRGQTRPTLKQLETFAKAACVPLGYLFLPEPPEEKLPIPDLRTLGGKGLQRPSPDLLDVVYLCQRRQAWYQDYAESIGEEPRAFVGSALLTTSPERIAADMRQRLGFRVEDAGSARLGPMPCGCSSNRRRKPACW